MNLLSYRMVKIFSNSNYLLSLYFCIERPICANNDHHFLMFKLFSNFFSWNINWYVLPTLHCIERNEWYEWTIILPYLISISKIPYFWELTSYRYSPSLKDWSTLYMKTKIWSIVQYRPSNSFLHWHLFATRIWLKIEIEYLKIEYKYWSIC